MIHYIKDPEIHNFLFSFIYATTKFKELAAATKDTEEKIKNFITLPEIERTFKSEWPNFQDSSSTTFPMYTGKDP